MRAMTLDQIQPSTKLGKTLYANDGRILLHRGTELTSEYLAHLDELGFTALYIEDAASPDFEPVEPVSEKTRMMAVASVRDAFSSLKPNQGLKLNADWTGRRMLYNAANSIVSEVTANRNLCIQMMELRGGDGFTFAHSVNVCILGMALAQKLRTPHHRLVDLAIGLMIHDIGKLVLPEELRHPDNVETEEQKAAYEKHTQAGWGLLKDLGSTFGAPSRIVALQHHERWDGLGYPRGLRGSEIHEFAQICAIANTYDLLTTTSAFGKRAEPHEALEYLMGCGGTYFSLPMVQAFLDVVAPYPLGTTVRLNTGEVGVVVSIPQGMPQRPVLALLEGDKLIDEGFALADHPDKLVVATVDGLAPSRV